MSMAVEFTNYLKQCEVSDFCSSLQSSVANLIGSSEKIKSSSSSLEQSTSAAIVLASHLRDPNASNCITLQSEVSKLSQETFSNNNQQIVTTSYADDDSVTAENSDGYKSPKESLSENNNYDTPDDIRSERIIYNLEQTKTDLVTQPKTVISASSSEVQSPLGNQSENEGDREALNNISEGVLCETFSLVKAAGASQLEVKHETACYTNLNSRNLRRSETKSCQRQLSLPSGYSSSHAEVSLNDSRSRRRRHSVRFADEIGELLSTIITIPSKEEQIIEAYSNSRHETGRANIVDFSWANNQMRTMRDRTGRILCPTGASNAINPSSQSTFCLCFAQPSLKYDDFLRNLQINGVCLESVRPQRSPIPGLDPEGEELTSGPMFGDTLECKVRVRNIEACKSVVARCTSDDWRTFEDIAAQYQSNATGILEEKEFDIFVFTITKPHEETDAKWYSNGLIKCSVEFAIRYQVRGLTFWDNNGGRNYRVVWK